MADDNEPAALGVAVVAFSDELVSNALEIRALMQTLASDKERAKLIGECAGAAAKAMNALDSDGKGVLLHEALFCADMIAFAACSEWSQHNKVTLDDARKQWVMCQAIRCGLLPVPVKPGADSDEAVH